MSFQISCARLLALVACLLSTVTHARPRVGNARDQNTAVNYLTRLGYLHMPDARAGQLRTNEELREGLKMFQLYAGIPMTGEVDEETMKMIRMPRCGMPDFGRSDRTRRRRRYAVQGTVWQKKELTYHIEGGPTSRISEKEVHEQVDKAFREWQRISTLKFTKTKSPSSDILVKFRRGMHSDGYPFDGAGGTLAHGFYPHDNEGLSGDVHFDDDETWILEKNAKGTDFYWTALHEIGHSLGLDHSNFKDAVMYPFYTGFKENLRLNEDDIKGIRYLYGMPAISVKTGSSDGVPTAHPSGMPRACSVPSFDAVFADVSRVTYFFFEKYYWMVQESGRRLGPYLIQNRWSHLPEKGIDAAYQSEGKTTFFKGKNCWIYNGTQLLQGPVPISKRFKNLDHSVESIDTAFIWGANGKTYLFKGDYYWKYNEATNKMDMGYPAKINGSWVGVPSNLDSAFTWINGRTYFFKRNGFWIFDNLRVETTQRQPMATNSYWMKCRDGIDEIDFEVPASVAASVPASVRPGTAGVSASRDMSILLISLLALVLNYLN